MKAVPPQRPDEGDVHQNNYYDTALRSASERGCRAGGARGKKSCRMRGGTGGGGREGGGTFTISNGGVYGSLLSTPILNPPQSGILGMHTIQKRPVAIKDEVVVRPMMYLALSYDHRAVDGKEAVTFLITVKQCIEDPKKLPLDFLERGRVSVPEVDIFTASFAA